MNGNTKALTELQAITAEALAALDTGHQIWPFSARLSAFDLEDAYRVTAAIGQMREMRGEIVTTGTLTRALPVSAGETWTTELTGVAPDGLCVRFAELE